MVDIVTVMKKYFIIFAAVAILGMLAIYFVPSKKTSTSSGSQTVTTNSSSTSTLAPSSSDTTTTTNTTTGASYKDGTFTGANVSTHYGNIKVAITVQSGKITDVAFLAVPNDDQHSLAISDEATPILESQTIHAQSTNIDGVSGATTTTRGYIQSLQAAIDAAKAS